MSYWTKPFYYMPMPVNADGHGPASAKETARVLHEVWDAAAGTVCVCQSESDARLVADIMNSATAA